MTSRRGAGFLLLLAEGGTGAGSWTWREAPYRHVLRNDGPAPLVIYEIDWR